jgi:hypothetical protein
MMTRDEALSFARFSAEVAFDQVGEWGTLQNSIDNYRQNVQCTLIENRASQYENEAYAAFDAVVAAKSS